MLKKLKIYLFDANIVSVSNGLLILPKKKLSRKRTRTNI